MALRSEIRDPGSGSEKNLFRIPDPGVKKAPDPGSATLHYSKEYNTSVCEETNSLYTFHEISVSNDMNIFL